MFISTFGGSDSAVAQFPADVVAAVNEFQSSGVTNLIIDVTGNGGS